MDEDDVKQIPIEQAHRLPARQRGGRKYPRGIIVKFSFYKDRDRTLQAARTKPDAYS